jgi:hypothetical protein
VKAAAAVLGASVLFFLGVLTGAGRQEALPPPVAIPLGVADSATSADQPTSPSPSSPSAPGGAATTQSTSSTSPAPSPPPAPTGSPTPPAPPAGGTTTSITAGPGQVEKVDNQVDCTPADKKGKGRRDPCPPTTATTEPGGGRGGEQNR